MKLILAIKYNIELKDWNMNHIKNIENNHDKILRGIYL